MKNQREFSNRTWLSFGLFVVLGLAIFGRIMWIQGRNTSNGTPLASGLSRASNPLLLRGTDLRGQRKCLGDFSARL